MEKYTVRAYVGPTAVKEIAKRMTDAGYLNVTEGTEYVYALSVGTTPEDAAYGMTMSTHDRLGIKASDFLVFEKA